ncbi:MAG TPA: HEAT repeat domain-containing protein, partial [Candidatus Rifleibacterium sp.]|nr:HEAT repeat domain-containing protein [Candidatus Rifleibacterium sp.]
SVRERPAEKKPTPQYEEITDPLVLIKTFSAPVEKRIEAIREAGQKKMAEAVPALIEALYEPDQSISLAATESLGQIGDPRAIEPLLEVSRRSDAALIRAIGHDSEKQPRVEAEKAQEDEANANPYKFKEMVVFKIDQLPVEYFQPDGTPLPRKELVVRGLKDNSQQMRQMAAKAATQKYLRPNPKEAIGLDSEDVVEPLIEALANPFEVESVRFMAAEALGGMQNDKSVESLLRALKDENVAVRYSAAAALSGRKDERVLAALIEAIDDPDRFVKASVAYALGTTLEPEALKALFRCVTDENDVVRFSAAKAIAAFPYDEVFTQLDAMSGQQSREAKL